MNTAPITQAICTRHRPDELRRALRSILDQSVRPAQILVVDNAPANDASRTLVAEEFPEVEYHREPIPGLDFARNRALAAATQPIVAFVDDDVVLDRGSVAELARLFDEVPNTGACTGRVRALSLETDGQQLFEKNGGFERGEVRVCLPDDATRRLHGRRAPLIAWALSVGSGSCLAVRRDVARALGGFDEALDLGPVLPGGGDHDMLWRILQAGHRVVYEPSVLAQHEHRRELDDVVSQIAGHQKGLIAMLTKSVARSSVRGCLPVTVYLGWRLLKPGTRLVRRAFGRDPLPAGALLEMWSACWNGLGAYRRGLREAALRREVTA